MTNPNKLDWKIAATVGTIAGVAIGGFAFAAPDNDRLPTPDGVILQDNATSAPRLSAPVVVPPTAAQLASAAPVVIPTTVADPASVADPAAVEVAELSAPSPISPAAPPAAPAPVADESAQVVVAPSPVVLDVDSPMSPVSVSSPASPDSPASPGSGTSS